MKALLQVGWTWEPTLIIGFTLWSLVYVWVNRNKHTPLTQQIAFHIGTIVGLLALVSPLDELGDEYLFSAHMIQHLLLMFLAAPLWLVGTPGWLAEWIIPQNIGKLGKRLANPMSAFVVFVGTLWFWHIPFMYQMALESEAVHIFEHLTFIGAALVGWWPIAGAETFSIPKPAPPLRMLYLFLLALPLTALAAVLTFAPTPLYPFYVTAPHIFGLDALQDQRLGGLFMWLPTHLCLLLALGITFLKWFADTDRKEKQSKEFSHLGGDSSLSLAAQNRIQN